MRIFLTLFAVLCIGGCYMFAQNPTSPRTTCISEQSLPATPEFGEMAGDRVGGEMAGGPVEQVRPEWPPQSAYSIRRTTPDREPRKCPVCLPTLTPVPCPVCSDTCPALATAEHPCESRTETEPDKCSTLALREGSLYGNLERIAEDCGYTLTAWPTHDGGECVDWILGETVSYSDDVSLAQLLSALETKLKVSITIDDPTKSISVSGEIAQ